MQILEQHSAVADVIHSGEDPQRIRDLVRQGASVWHLDSGGRSPLHWAANISPSGPKYYYPLLQCVGSSHQCSYVSLEDAMGKTAMHWAADKANFQLVQYLFVFQADPFHVDKNNETALHAVAKYDGNPEEALAVANVLVQNAAATNHTTNLIDVVAKGDQKTALFYAVAAGNLLLVKYFLEKGASVLFVDTNGSSVLHLAVQYEHEEISIQLFQTILMAARACAHNFPTILDIQDKWSRTVLHLAARAGNFRILELLVDAGSEVGRGDRRGNTALHVAASLGSDEISWRCVEQLLKRIHEMNPQERKLYVNHVNDKSQIALYLAGKMKNLNATRKLFLTEPDYHIRSSSNKTPLEQVYRNVPEAMVVALDQAAKQSSYSRRDGVISSMARIDFGPILGRSSDSSKEFREIDELAKINHIKKLKPRETVLNHTLVKVFVWKKWEQIWWIFVLSRFLHILGFGLGILFLLRNFRIDCPFIGSQNTTIRFSMFSMSPLEHEDELPMRTSKFGECQFGNFNYIGAILLMIFALFVLLADIFPSIQRFKWYYKPFNSNSSTLKNVGKLTLLVFHVVPVPQVTVFILVLLTMTPVFGQFLLTETMHFLFVAILGFTLSFCIFLEIGKIPQCKVYINLLIKISRSILFASLVVVVLLIGFSVLFVFLLPGTPAFSSMPQAFVKMITLSIGELDYQDTIYEQKYTTLKRVIMVAYGVFIFCVVLILMNFLIALATNDIKEYRKVGGNVWKMCTQIEQIMLLESFLDTCGGCLGRYILNKYLMIMPPYRKGEQRRTAEISIPHLPKDLQKELHELLGLNEIAKLE